MKVKKNNALLGKNNIKIKCYLSIFISSINSAVLPSDFHLQPTSHAHSYLKQEVNEADGLLEFASL